MTSMDTRTDYALIAREILALTRGGTLHVRGIEDLPADTDASFYDDEGTPTFVTTEDSPLVAAARARRGAVLAIPAGAATGYTQVVLGGHIVVLSEPGDDVSEDCDGVPDGVVAVGMLVHTIVLERDAPESPSVGYRSVPLAEWTAATPDPLRPAAHRILSHTNAAHAAQLRDYVAGLRAIPVTDVLAAELANLDASGVDLTWLDSRGAHQARIRFEHPADCPGELAARLREVLTRR